MKNIITTISLSSKIWFRTAIVFSVGILIFSVFKTQFGAYNILVFIFGTLAALVSSMPVLISLFILLPYFQKRNRVWQRKLTFFFLYILFVTLCYGLVAASLNFDFFYFPSITENKFFTNLFLITALLFTCSCVMQQYFVICKVQPGQAQTSQVS